MIGILDDSKLPPVLPIYTHFVGDHPTRVQNLLNLGCVNASMLKTTKSENSHGDEYAYETDSPCSASTTPCGLHGTCLSSPSPYICKCDAGIHY